MSEDPKFANEWIDLSASPEDVQALEATFRRLLPLTERMLPLVEALNSSDPVRAADAREPAQEILKTHELIWCEALLRLNVIFASSGPPEAHDKLRAFVAQLSMPFERLRAALDKPEFIFRGTGKEIGDA